MGAPETTTAGEEVCVGTTTLKWPALPKAAATTFKHEGFARNMVRMGSALLKAVMKVLVAVVSAASIVPNQSALGNGAPHLPN